MATTGNATPQRAGARADLPWRAVVVFVLLTVLLSSVFWAFIDLTRTVTALC